MDKGICKFLLEEGKSTEYVNSFYKANKSKIMKDFDEEFEYEINHIIKSIKEDINICTKFNIKRTFQDMVSNSYDIYSPEHFIKYHTEEVILLFVLRPAFQKSIEDSFHFKVIGKSKNGVYYENEDKSITCDGGVDFLFKLNGEDMSIVYGSTYNLETAKYDGVTIGNGLVTFYNKMENDVKNLNLRNVIQKAATNRFNSKFNRALEKEFYTNAGDNQSDNVQNNQSNKGKLLFWCLFAIIIIFIIIMLAS